MSTLATHTTWMTQRQLRAMVRQPAYLAITLIQPVIWLFLFGSLFRKVVELPGFGAPSYLDYLHGRDRRLLSGGLSWPGRGPARSAAPVPRVPPPAASR